MTAPPAALRGHRCNQPAGHPTTTTLCRCRCGATTTTTRKDR